MRAATPPPRSPQAHGAGPGRRPRRRKGDSAAPGSQSPPPSTEPPRACTPRASRARSRNTMRGEEGGDGTRHLAERRLAPIRGVSAQANARDSRRALWHRATKPFTPFPTGCRPASSDLPVPAGRAQAQQSSLRRGVKCGDRMHHTSGRHDRRTNPALQPRETAPMTEPRSLHRVAGASQTPERHRQRQHRWPD